MTLKLKRYKKSFAHSYTFGVFPTLELLHHQPGRVMEIILHTKGERNTGIAQIRDICAESGIPYRVSDKTVERLTQRGNDYVVGVFEKQEGILDGGAGHLVLVNPGDMGNLGTIMRTMLGFNRADLAVIRPAADIYHPRCVRASMGAVHQIRFQHFGNFNDYQTSYPDHHLYPFMLDGTVSLDKVGFREPSSLVFGSESAGLPETFHRVGESVTIPQSGQIDSLNLSIAVGIALYSSSH